MQGSGRANTHCFCCLSKNISREWGATSLFFAWRALRRGPEAVPVIRCNACRTRYFDFTPTDEELGRLYADYREEEYFCLRNRFEPAYTRKLNELLGGNIGMQDRRNVLIHALKDCGIVNQFSAVLDHGGDRGQMLLDLNADVKVVYEISGVAPEPGVRAVLERELWESDWDLILSCHVLEHLTDPETYLSSLLTLGRAETIYFIEVPNENFRSFSASGWQLQKLWIDLVSKWPWLFNQLDHMSRGFDYRLHFIPPLLFFPLCEHLSFFTVQGLTALLERLGLKVLSAKVRETGHITVVARRIGQPIPK